MMTVIFRHYIWILSMNVVVLEILFEADAANIVHPRH